MLVQVLYGAREGYQGDTGYTYETYIDGLQIGDIVMVPPTPYSGGEQEATVVNLSSDYEGPVKSITRLVRRKR